MLSLRVVCLPDEVVVETVEEISSPGAFPGLWGATSYGRHCYSADTPALNSCCNTDQNQSGCAAY